MLKISAAVGRKYVAQAAALNRNLPNIFRNSSATSSRSVPSPTVSNLASLSNITVSTVYRTSVAAVNAAWRSLVPGMVRSSVRVPSSTPAAVRGRFVASKYLNKRGYSASNFEVWAKEEPVRRRGVLSYVWSGVRQMLTLGTLVLNATAIWHIHGDMHKDNPTWVSYMSFIPFLDWVPMLDIAGLSRAWMLLPVVLLGFSVATGTIASIPGAFFIMMPMFALEMYRNWHILSHFEQANWVTVVLWSFLRLEWVTMSALAILGTERYQLVPHEQANIGQSLKQVALKLEESVEKPELVPEHNYPFRFFHWLWVYIPPLRHAQQNIEWLYNLSGLDPWMKDIDNALNPGSLAESITTIEWPYKAANWVVEHLPKMPEMPSLSSLPSLPSLPSFGSSTSAEKEQQEEEEEEEDSEEDLEEEDEEER
jgi:hypothetical protein